MEDNYLTLDQLSDRLDISPDRLVEMRHETDGPAYKVIDREVFYLLEDVIAFEHQEAHMRDIMGF